MAPGFLLFGEEKVWPNLPEKPNALQKRRRMRETVPRDGAAIPQANPLNTKAGGVNLPPQKHDAAKPEQIQGTQTLGGQVCFYKNILWRDKS